MSERLTDLEFGWMRDWIAQEAGLVFEESRRPGLTRAVRDRQRATGSHDVSAYLRLLRLPSAGSERERLIDAVTIQATHFWRNQPQMDALRDRILPALLHRAAACRRPLTIWSAGCSTGEEPYTLAMLAHGLSGGDVPVNVVGTDVSPAALAVAARAVYGARAMSLVPPAERDRWFATGTGGPGSWAVRDEVRRLVTLRRHNLVTEPVPFAPGEVDLVVCRNVTIDFGRTTTTAVVGRLHAVLPDGGWLLLGHAETLWQVTDVFTRVPVGEAFAYRRDAVAVPRAADRTRPPAPTRAVPAQLLPLHQPRVEPVRMTGGHRHDSRFPAAPPLDDEPATYPAYGSASAPLGWDPRRPGGYAPAPGGATLTGRSAVAPHRSDPEGSMPAGAALGAAARPAVADVSADVAARATELVTALWSTAQSLAAGHNEEAVACAVRAIGVDALCAAAHAAHSRALVCLGRDEEALGALRRAAYLDPAAGDVHFLLAGALARRDEHGAAAGSYRAAAATLPDLPASRLAELLDGRAVGELVELCTRLADLGDAELADRRRLG